MKPSSLRPFLRRLRAVLYRRFFRTVIHSRGRNNSVAYSDSLLDHCDFRIEGHDNRIEIGPGSRLWNVKIRLVGENLLCRIGQAARLRGGQFQIEDRGSTLEIGAQANFYQLMIFSAEGKRVVLGDDCLIAYGVDLRNSDAHAVIDARTRVRLNPAADIVVGNHVWIGNNAQVLKGTSIGAASVIAARSVVTGSIPAGVIAAGTPARVIRENIDWDHRRS